MQLFEKNHKNFMLIICNILSGSEFIGKEFRRTLKQYNVHQYFLNSGIWSKNALCEIAIKNLKRIFMRILKEYNTLKFEHILHLTQSTYNNR